MRYKTISVESFGQNQRHIILENRPESFTSFSAEIGNPNYDSFLQSQSLTDAEVQAMEPDVWHDMA